ncbi:LysE family translocator [Undibacterium fentianense]|uniref:LysE family transporter n=1 Tax=Undibacterium fentianense TaxID=2828728 RepID=A0A941DZ20_9BURK|nr:LysE family transporter [Undibacterium fentianense]MBR7800094.1 LysE family transporter [Undibacterium fentianense]
MNFATWFSFFCAACLIAISPGSGAILSMSHGLAFGVKRASVTIFGLQLGLLLVLFIAGAGVGSLLLASETAFNVVKVLGAVYLMYLGVTQFLGASKIGQASSAPDDNPEAAPTSNPISASTTALLPSVRRRILTGFITNASNPKGIVFMVAVLPNFINSEAPLLPQLGILAVTMVFVDTTVMHSYALLAASLQHWMREARAQRIQNRLFGAILILIGASLFFVKREQSVSL